jgi:SAM-dependent methyltransferase
MARSRIVVSSLYDHPQYYDIAFQAFTRQEADFIEAACRKYCPFGASRFLEPACGTGRLVAELATRGYQVTGFDVSQPALSYLRRRLTRRGLHAQTFKAEMSDFRLGRPVDAAYCTINTFRLLLTEQAAHGHLACIAGSLRPGGIYVIGLQLVSLDDGEEGTHCWMQRRGKTKVTVTQRVLCIDRRRRIENFQVCLMARRGSNEFRLQHEFQHRTYTAMQFRRLVGSVLLFELCDVYDFRYNIKQPFAPNHEAGYSVFVLRRGQAS